MNEIYLKRAHRHSYANKDELKHSKICGCFNCLKIFSPKDIKEYIDDKEGMTAVCPYCGIDSIIGESSEYKISREFLKEMKDYWM